MDVDKYKVELRQALQWAHWVDIEIAHTGLILATCGVLLKPFFLITATKNGFTDDRNQNANDSLLADLQSLKLCVCPMRGHCLSQGEPLHPPAVEFIHFVTCANEQASVARAWAMDLCSIYRQTCAAFSDGDNFGMLYPNGTFAKQFKTTELDPQGVLQAWSLIRGQQFFSAQCAYFPGNTFARYIVSRLGLISGINDSSAGLRKLWEIEKRFDEVMASNPHMPQLWNEWKHLPQAERLLLLQAVPVRKGNPGHTFRCLKHRAWQIKQD
jgi:hypothetical protein